MDGARNMPGEPPADIPPTFPLSRELFDETVLWAWEQQLRLDDVLGGSSPYGSGPWWMDPHIGTITFNHGRQPSLAAAAHFLGSASPSSGVWVWSWADSAGFPPPVVDAAARLRVYAQSYEHDNLDAPTIALAGDAKEFAWRIGCYAAWALDLPCYLFDAGGGVIGAVLVEHPMFALREPTPYRIVQAVHRALDSGLVSDWPRALASYAKRRGLVVQNGPAGCELRTLKGGAATVELDAWGNVGLVDTRAD